MRLIGLGKQMEWRGSRSSQNVQGQVIMSSEPLLEGVGNRGREKGEGGLSLVMLPSSCAGSSGAQLLLIVTHAGIGFTVASLILNHLHSCK